MTVSSPCVRICKIDRTNGLCEGCGRTLEEIAAWATLDEPARRVIMAQLPERLRFTAKPVGRCVPRKGSAGRGC